MFWALRPMQPRLTPSPSRRGRSSTNLLACRPLPLLVNLNDMATRLLAAASGRRGTSSGSAGGWRPDACGPHRHQPSRFRGDRADASLGSASFENKSNTKGERYVWLEPAVVARLRVLRGSGESYSDIILRVAAEGVERTK